MGRKIGIIASESTETEARVILAENEERNVKIEDLVLIKNRCGNLVLAVCRKGQGVDENLRVSGTYRPSLAYVKRGRTLSNAKQHFNFRLSVIADITEGFTQNRLIIAPGSEVYAFDPDENPMEYLSKEIKWDGEIPYIGYYKDRENWKVPVDPNFIPQHIGIFGVTGCGKSYLAKYCVIPALLKTGYDILIFDWKGYDYATHPKYRDKVLKIGDLHLDNDVIVEYLASKMEYFRYSGASARTSKPYLALTDIIHDKPWRKHLKNLEEFVSAMEGFCDEVLEEMIEGGEIRKSDAPRYRKQFVRGLQRLSEEDIEVIRGEITPEELLERVRQNHLCVIDMSGGEKETKLSLFLTIARHLRRLIERKREELNLGLVIDEAPQYCPYKPSGIENKTTEMIKDLCAIGRAYKLCVVLLSQGMAGEIGINAAVRRNINTLFIGRIHPLDRQEAENLLGNQGVDIDFLTKLPTGHFYFLGSMNPAPVPLLISFKPE